MMPYIDLLKQKEWSQKCVSILNRDRYICQDCGHVGFHNGDESFMEVADIGEINKMFDGWKFDGLNFSDFISNFSQYECETPKAIILERERLQGNEELYNLKLWLYGQNTKYFCNAHTTVRLNFTKAKAGGHLPDFD